MLRRLFRRREKGGEGAEWDAGLRVYAIGDVHGRADLLAQMVAAIEQDGRDHPIAEAPYVILLGDLIDRGPDSRGVVELALGLARNSDWRTVVLMGNHERMMLDSLDDVEVMQPWLAYGGDSTVVSYGVSPLVGAPTPERLERIRSDLAAAVPGEHLSFLDGLPGSFSLCGYCFVHAGIRPGKPLAAQGDHEHMWAGQAFLQSKADHGAIIVHGHHITANADIRPNRIGIDTGAYCSGMLTCLVIEAGGIRLIEVRNEDVRKTARRPRPHPRA